MSVVQEIDSKGGLVDCITLAEARLLTCGLLNGELHHHPGPSPSLLHHLRPVSVEIAKPDIVGSFCIVKDHLRALGVLPG
jgi:hypothetical protein